MQLHGLSDGQYINIVANECIAFHEQKNKTIEFIKNEFVKKHALPIKRWFWQNNKKVIPIKTNNFLLDSINSLHHMKMVYNSMEVDMLLSISNL